MFRIGEFSKLTQVSIRMLRYYDEMSLLEPAYIDPQSGYRMYSADQIPLLNKIIYLRDSGFQISEIASALSQKDTNYIAEQFTQKYTEIEQNIQMEQEKLRKIELAKKALLLEKSEMHYQVSIKSIPSYHVLSLRKIIANYYAEGDLWLELSTFAKDQHVSFLGSSFSIYHDADYREENVDVEICAVVKKTGESFGKFTFRHTPAVPLIPLFGQIHWRLLRWRLFPSTIKTASSRLYIPMQMTVHQFLISSPIRPVRIELNTHVCQRGVSTGQKVWKNPAHLTGRVNLTLKCK